MAGLCQPRLGIGDLRLRLSQRGVGHLLLALGAVGIGLRRDALARERALPSRLLAGQLVGGSGAQERCTAPADVTDDAHPRAEAS